MRPATRQVAGRSAIAAVVLSGLGPGAGHAYVGRPGRGAILVVLLAVTSLAWVEMLPTSYDAARLFGLPPTLLLLALLVDSGRLARRAPRPFALAPWQRWWTYGAIIVATGFAAPAALAAAMASRAGIVVAPDDGLEPVVLRGDWLIVDRQASERVPERGEVVVLAQSGRAPLLRRVVGLPGDSVAVRRGVVDVGGVPLPSDLGSPWLGRELWLDRTDVAPDHILVLSDRRRRAEAKSALVSLDAVRGIASWIVLPADHDMLRLGARP